MSTIEQTFDIPSTTDLLTAVPHTSDVAAALQHESNQVAIAGNLLQIACHGAASRAGWWQHKKSGYDLKRVITKPEGPLEELLKGLLVSNKLCLIHSEISEAMEGDRKGLMDDHLPHRTMVEVELADAVIRACDLAGAMGLNLGGAIAEKLAYNAQRPDHKPEAREAVGGKAY